MGFGRFRYCSPSGNSEGRHLIADAVVSMVMAMQIE